jgi:hypothetical protein
MPKKTKPSATKKPTKKAGGSAPKLRTKAPAKKRPPSPKKTTGNSRERKPASFEEAKSAAIDSLIEAIELGERRLSAVKRASSQDELTKAWQADGS